LPDTRERLELSVLIQKFRKTIFGSDGILNRTDLYAGKSRDLVQQNNAKQFVVRNIKADTELLMASAHGQLTQAGRLTQATTQRLIVILAIAAIVVFGIVVLAILVIVERQINARIGLLTGSVLRIAAGDTDHESQVSGSDELGRMADALNIFKQNARELLRSNAELEKFAYAAAHDLRSPLQAIHDLTVWTIEDSENKLSKDSAENLGLLQARVSRLSALLGDLLQYARIGADTAESFPFDLDDMVNESVAMLDPAGAFQVTHDWSGGEIETYHHPLQMILLNLIGNTLKHHGSSKGQIHISSTIVGDRLWVEYADDGPGIPPEYHLKVFGLFQTLKPRDEMEGSGLGLAITQKLVEHFEGAITIQPNGETASGTTFVFDFPARSVCAVAKAA
jgi:signal transduction histidine kinase